jgi:hypothetical protein
VDAGFDVSAKTCNMVVGAGMMSMTGPPSGGQNGKKLMSGFQSQFSQISV